MPDPPDPVDHTMVEIKGRVTGGDEKVTARVAAEGKVAATVDADVGHVTLELVLELEDVLRLEDGRERGGGVGEHLVDGGCEVALQAARVICKGAGGVLLVDAAGQIETDWTKIDAHVLEGARGDASTTRAGGEVQGRKTSADAQDEVRLVWNEGPVAGHGGVAAVEDGRVLHALDGGQTPVPVRLAALVTALVLEGSLVEPGVVAVPREEVAGPVNRHGLVDVGGDEVIEPALGAWDQRRGCPCRL